MIFFRKLSAWTLAGILLSAIMVTSSVYSEYTAREATAVHFADKMELRCLDRSDKPPQILSRICYLDRRDSYENYIFLESSLQAYFTAILFPLVFLWGMCVPIIIVARWCYKKIKIKLSNT